MSKSVTVRCYGKSPGYARGGLHQMAENTRQAGRKHDEVLLHLSPEEFQVIRAQWGEPDINPHTGLPEYAWLSDAFEQIAPTLQKIIPGLNHSKMSASEAALAGVDRDDKSGALEKLFNRITGADLQGSSGTDAAITAVLGALIAKLTGGSASEGAKIGAIGSVGLPMIGNALSGTGMGKSLGITPKDTILDEVGMGDFAGGRKAAETPDTPLTGDETPGQLRTAGLKKNWPLLLAQAAYIQKQRQGWDRDKQAQQGALTAAQQQFNRPTPVLPAMNRAPVPLANLTDYYTYGERPSKSFYDDSSLNSVVNKAQGGVLTGFSTGTGENYVQGPGTGRSDEIDAKLSNGEYVMDAETVSLLGDGSSDAGAKKLDELRQRIRMHKGKKLAKGEFSDDAGDPTDYLGEE